MPFDPKTFILVHVMLSLLGLFTGMVVVGGWIAGVQLRRWLGVFLASTVLTSLTGFGFPFVTLLPPHVVGGLSLLVLAGAIGVVYLKPLRGAWRSGFVVLSVIALYLNAFVLLAQLFLKIPAMAMLAPHPGAPAAAASQALLLALFIGLGWAAVRGFKGGAQGPMALSR
jgi:hypothetical protein